MEDFESSEVSGLKVQFIAHEDQSYDPELYVLEITEVGVYVIG